MNRKVSNEWLVIIISLLFNFLLHLLGDMHAGFHGDELLHIEAGKHLAAGYPDFPPMIALLASFQNIFHSHSVFINHLTLYLASALILVLTGMITLELGGRWRAVMVTLVLIILAPGFGASHSLFLPDIFDQLAWISFLYFIVRFCKDDRDRWLILAGMAAGFGFLTKYTIMFAGAGFALSLLFFRRDLLRRRGLWMGAIVFSLIVLPNIIWQMTNEFPVFRHMSTLYDTQLNNRPPIKEISDLVLFLNPLSSLLWAGGLAALIFDARLRGLRLYTWTLLLSFLFLAVAKGKSYYFFPVILGLIPIGAVTAERITNNSKWVLTTFISIAFISGVYLIPNGIPVLTLEKYISIYHLKKNKDNRIPLPFENYYSKPIWDSIISVVSREYNILGSIDREKCLIWGRHYSEAGAINLLGEGAGLPGAFSFHSSFYEWVPDFDRSIVVIGISDGNLGENYWLQYFDEVKPVGFVENYFTSDLSWYRHNIFLCRKPRYDSKELKIIFSDQIF